MSFYCVEKCKRFLSVEPGGQQRTEQQLYESSTSRGDTGPNSVLTTHYRENEKQNKWMEFHPLKAWTFMLES